MNLYFQCLSRSTAVEIVNSSKVLQAETRMLLDGKLLVQLYSFIHVFSLSLSLFPSSILFSLIVFPSLLKPFKPRHLTFHFLLSVYLLSLLYLPCEVTYLYSQCPLCAEEQI